jgi:hypothetical protein
MILKIIFFAGCYLTFCDSYGHNYGHQHQHQDQNQQTQHQTQSNLGVKGRSGFSSKTYGGIFPDTAGHNQAANEFVQNRNYQQPQIPTYQPYGWNSNQPVRTYGNKKNFRVFPFY